MNAYTCSCPDGFDGNQCETNIDDCEGDSCQGGGTCVDSMNGHTSVEDPGFPVGGRGPRRGGPDFRGGYVLKILYVKTKESGPLGGRALGTPPLDPPMHL